MALLLTAVMGSCTESQYGQTPTDAIAPGPLTVTSVESLPGGAKITYNLPDETDMSYVKGVYTVDGVRKEVRASVYNNFVVIEGLGSVNPVEVTLTVVDHSENASTAVVKTITPGTPPIQKVFESLQLFPDFGGISIKWKDEDGAQMGFTVFADRWLNDTLEEGETKFFTDKDGSYTFRGYDDAKRRYAVQIRDVYGNLSELKEGEFAPYFEHEFDQTSFAAVWLPGDNNTVSSSRPLELCWNGNRYDLWHTSNLATITETTPQTITIDLLSQATDPATAKLSRFYLWPRNRSDFFFGNNCFEWFELWGTKELKGALDDDSYWTGQSWKSDWEMLGDYRIIKPEVIPATVEEVALNYYNFVVPIEKEEVRYVRFVVKKTWGTTGAMHMAEFEFWGDDGKREEETE